MKRYDRVAMSLHWLIASAIVGNLALGWWMHEAIEEPARQALATAAFQWHKSIGLSVLALSLMRLAWRLSHRPPALPKSMGVWQRRAAGLTHIGFYAVMLALPLSGWLYASTQWRADAPLSVPTLWFGWLEVPHLLSLNQLHDALRSLWSERLLLTHEVLAYGTVALLVLHVAAALKHQFINHDDVLLRMWPATQSGLWLGLTSFALLCGALAVSVNFGGSGQRTGPSMIESSPDGWQVDAATSTIQFSGVHAGEPFSGRFEAWQVDLQLNPAQPQTSTLYARIDTSSARDGNPLHDETLPQAEWFDVANYPYAEFRSERITAQDDGLWAVYGQLRIKDQQHKVGPLLMRLDQQQAEISAQLQIERKDYDLGMESDPSGQWIALNVGIRIALTATAP